jgi:hypothetical protein
MIETMPPFTSQVPEVPGNVVILEDISQIPFPKDYRSYRYISDEGMIGSEKPNQVKSSQPNLFWLFLAVLVIAAGLSQ